MSGAAPAKTYTVGQVLCAVLSGHRRGEVFIIDVTVTKVGRRWVEFDGWKGKGPYINSPRFDKANGHVDSGGYSSFGTVYESRAAYEAMVKRLQAWNGLTSALRHSHDVPAAVTHDDIRQAAKLLGVELIHGK